MTEELLPCPFCGNNNPEIGIMDLEYDEDRACYTGCEYCAPTIIKCTCGILIKGEIGQKEFLIKKWNTRKGENDGK